MRFFGDMMTGGIIPFGINTLIQYHHVATARVVEG
jgi:hypothetical protein